MKSIVRTHWKILVVLLLVGAYTFGSLAIYTARSLNGDPSKAILAGEMFGTPEELAQRGVKPLFYGPGQTGWDGQFYYYISNDLLARKDTRKHLDADAYRYQRVGMSAFVAAASKVTFRGWVSPKFYLATYLMLIMFATGVLAALFQRWAISPFWAVLWPVSVGTQFTTFNALPDAAADAFLILALYAVHRRWYLASAVPFAFSALSREVYVLVPSAILALALVLAAVEWWKGSHRSVSAFTRQMLKLRSAWFLVIPGLVGIGWRMYVSRAFDASISKQAAGILGKPFQAWWQYLSDSLHGKHPLAPGTEPGRWEAVLLIGFVLLLFINLALALKVLIGRKSLDTEVGGLALSMLPLTALYACFGPTVMMHYSGYFKVLGLVCITIPLLVKAAGAGKWWSRASVGALVLFVLISSYHNQKIRILARVSNIGPLVRQYVDYPGAFDPVPPGTAPCDATIESDIVVKDAELIEAPPAHRLLGRADLVLMNLSVRNTGPHSWKSVDGKGGIFLGSQWTDYSGQLAVAEGVQLPFRGEVAPNERRTMSLLVAVPGANMEGKLKLFVSIVQRECSWEYLRVRPSKRKPAFTLNNLR